MWMRVRPGRGERWIAGWQGIFLTSLVGMVDRVQGWDLRHEGNFLFLFLKPRDVARTLESRGGYCELQTESKKRVKALRSISLLLSPFLHLTVSFSHRGPIRLSPQTRPVLHPLLPYLFPRKYFLSNCEDYAPKLPPQHPAEFHS